jgi:thiamine monophosphate kinase
MEERFVFGAAVDGLDSFFAHVAADADMDFDDVGWKAVVVVVADSNFATH